MIRATDSVATERGMPSGKLTLSQFAESVYVPAKLDLSPGRVTQLLISIRAVDKWARRPVQIGQLTEPLILRFLAAHLKDHAPSTVNARRRDILAILRLAYRRKYTKHDPERMEIPKVREPKRLVKAWTKHEVARLIAQARRLSGCVGMIPRRDWWPSFLLTIWDSSARVGSVKQALVRRLNLREGHLILYHQKTACEQLYWLSAETLSSIASHYCPHRELLFPWPYCRDYLWRYFRQYVVEPAGLIAETTGMGLFAKLRRSRITDQVRTTSLEDGRRLAGHTRPEITWRHYV
ncbi:MAG: hypothetical protein ACYTEX_24285, partial [Planctomycetota bacterium]